MSGTGDCASQEIEASTSSNSTRNSKKFCFVQSILNTENSQNISSNVPRIFIGREKVPELPMLEKNDFIKNWIIAHNNLADSPEKSYPNSPVLGISSAKRSPQSPILGYQWKRIKREADSKENCRVSLNKKFQRYSEPEIFLSSNNDSDKTLTSVKSPVLNRITNSPILNTRPPWFGEPKSPNKLDADSTLKWNDRKSLVRDNAKITESLSLSSPLCERNNPFKIVDDSNYPKQSIEALNQKLLQFSELLVEETPFDVEVISLSSKIPETLSHSTIDAELKANSKKNQFERLNRSPSSSNSIKFEAETSSNHGRHSQSHESSNSSVRLSIPSVFRNKKLMGIESCDASWMREKSSSIKLEAVETLRGFDELKEIQESSMIPDTLSVSSQLRESLVPEPVNYLDQSSINSALRNKKVTLSSSLVKSEVPESADSLDCLLISSPLRRKKFPGNKPTNTSWIRGKNNCVKSQGLGTLQGLGQSKKIRESLQIPETLSVSSELDEILVPESVNYLDRLSIPSPLRNKKVIVSSPLVKIEVPESSDSQDRLSIFSPLRRKKFLGVKSTDTSWVTGKKSLQIPETLSVSSQLDEILVSETSNSLNQSSLAKNVHAGIKSVNISSTRAKYSSTKSEASGNLQELLRSKKIRESLQIPVTLSQLDETRLSETSNSLNQSSLIKNVHAAIKSVNASSTRAKNSSTKSEASGNLQELVRLKKSRESLQIPETLSQLDETRLPETLNSLNQSSLTSSLAKNVHIGIKTVNTPWIIVKDDPIKFEAVASEKIIKNLIEIGKSSKISNTLSECVDVESSRKNAPEDDIKIDSDSDGTISDFIENVPTQNGAAITNRKFSESKSRRDTSCDSDETYYSDGDSIPRLQITKASPLKNSQKISESTSQSNEGRVSENRSESAISQAASPLKNNNIKPQTNVMSLHTTNNINKKKKKGKKGSLVAKLQTIVNSQVSNLRIWRYQMSRPDFKNSQTQFVKLKIRERETRFGRHYLTASVIEDSHNLLKSINESESNLANEKSDDSFHRNIITLVMVPEIIGFVKIRARSIIKIYPPWEIMERGRKILNVMFFNLGAPEEANFDNEVVTKDGNKNILQEFECPCIRAKTLVDSCRAKFSNTKPSVVQAIFSSVN